MTPAKRRRAHGSGSVVQRHDHRTCPPPSPDGKRPKHNCQGSWAGRYEAGSSPSGARRRRTVTGRTKAEAERRLKDARRAIADGASSGTTDPRITVKAWAAIYLPAHMEDVRPNSYTTDAGAIRKWVIPTIGQKRLTSLAPADVRAVRTAIVNAGLTTTTARQAQSALRTMLKAAAEEGHPIPEAVFRVKHAPVALNDRDTIPEADAVAILDASLHDPREAARWGLALLAALRPGEACGLRWADVDLEQQLVTVEWQRQELPYIDRRNKAAGFRVPVNYEAVLLTGTYHLVRPKNKRGLRVVPLVDDAANALRAWRDVAEVNPWDLVFTDTDPRPGRNQAQTVRSKKVDARHWIEVQDRAQVAHISGTEGRRYISYECRHTCATLLAMLNVPASVREQIVGHSAAVAARSYIHAQQTDTRAGLDLVSARLNETRKAIAAGKDR